MLIYFKNYSQFQKYSHSRWEKCIEHNINYFTPEKVSSMANTFVIVGLPYVVQILWYEQLYCTQFIILAHVKTALLIVTPNAWIINHFCDHFNISKAMSIWNNTCNRVIFYYSWFPNSIYYKNAFFCLKNWLMLNHKNDKFGNTAFK